MKFDHWGISRVLYLDLFNHIGRGASPETSRGGDDELLSWKGTGLEIRILES